MTRLAPSRGSPIAGTALLIVVPLCAGVAVAREPSVAVPLAMTTTVAVWLVLRGVRVWWDVLVLTVGGVYVLDYGFANIGVPGPVAMPLVDLLGIGLLGYAATRPGFRWPSSAPFLLAGAFIGLTLLRVVNDYPTHGVLAIRDATLGLELIFLFVGYWAIERYGLERVLRALTIIFLIGLGYTMLYPFRDTIAAFSPVVGLQRPVPLVGSYVGNLVFVSAFFFFALVRPFGSRSYVIAALALPVMALVQLRGLYLAVPLAIVLVWGLARAQGSRMRKRLAATLGAGLALLVLFMPIAPEGRLGKVSPKFLVAHLATLAGSSGAGAGSLEDRKEWFDNVIDEVESARLGWIVGVGLGPDLAAGAEHDGVLIRKPHNDYLEIFARYGLIGFVVFLALLGTTFGRLVSAARGTAGNEGAFLWFAIAQGFVFCVIAATQPLLAFPYGTVPLFFVLGAALSVAGQSYPGANGLVRWR
jgi:O-antigen ligase